LQSKATLSAEAHSQETKAATACSNSKRNEKGQKKGREQQQTRTETAAGGEAHIIELKGERDLFGNARKKIFHGKKFSTA